MRIRVFAALGLLVMSGWSLAGDLVWIPWAGGEPPTGAIKSGVEGKNVMYVCRAPYDNGLHPGKLFNGKCNIAYEAKEHALVPAEVLVAKTQPSPTTWGFLAVNPDRADLTNAVEGGYEPMPGGGKRILYVCVATAFGGQPGKFIPEANRCIFSHGGHGHEDAPKGVRYILYEPPGKPIAALPVGMKPKPGCEGYVLYKQEPGQNLVGYQAVQCGF